MIRVQLSTAPGLGSTFIRWYTWSPFSHVDFVLPNGDLLGARLDGGVRVRSPEYSPFSRVMVLEAPFAPSSVLDMAQAQIGAGYDWLALFGMGLRRNWCDDERWFCSELVAYAFQAGGYPILNANHLNRVTPRDICISPLFNIVRDTGGAP